MTGLGEEFFLDDGYTSGKEVRKRLLEEVTFDLEPEWREGDRECLPPLKGHDNLCSRL